MKHIFIDTNILIDYSKGYIDNLKDLFQLQSQNKATLYINPLVIMEFTADQKLSNKELENKAEKFLLFFNILPVTAKTGFIAGQLHRTSQVEFVGDALIAATCLEHNLELSTRNEKHFKNVVGLNLVTLPYRI